MKKFFAVILAVVYFATSMGATVHLHYCMGKLFSWSLIDKDSKNCGLCGMPKHPMSGHCVAFKNGCCKDTHKHIQLNKDQKVTEDNYTFLDLSPAVLPATTATLPDMYASACILGYPNINAPPEPDKVPLFIRHCDFRI